MRYSTTTSPTTMMTVYRNVTELVGNTPLVELTNYERNHGLGATLVGKVESFNPTGSVKDRAALAMIEAAEAAGLIDDETVLIEPTSGNTGIALAAIAAARGNRIIITMPDKGYSDKDKKILERVANTCPVHASLSEQMEQRIVFRW